VWWLQVGIKRVRNDDISRLISTVRYTMAQPVEWNSDGKTFLEVTGYHSKLVQVLPISNLPLLSAVIFPSLFRPFRRICLHLFKIYFFYITHDCLWGVRMSRYWVYMHLDYFHGLYRESVYLIHISWCFIRLSLVRTFREHRWSLFSCTSRLIIDAGCIEEWTQPVFRNRYWYYRCPQSKFRIGCRPTNIQDRNNCL
jgi:hypothetical protein